jgi:hypothetical protein
VLSRIHAALSLLVVRIGWWVRDLSPAGRALLIATLVVLIEVARYYGLLPSRGSSHHRDWVFK